MTVCLVADDHALVRDALALAVADLFDDAEVRTAHDFPEAWRQAALTPQPCFITADLSMPGAGPVEGIARLFAIAPAARIVAITGVEDDDLMLQVLATGVSGFVPKTASASLIAGALQLVKAGGTYLPPRLLHLSQIRPVSPHEAEQAVPAEGRTGLPNAGSPSPAPTDRSTPDLRQLGSRQREVLCLMADGLSNKDIARKLNLSPATVKGYVAQLIAHFNAQNRTQAVTRARDSGAV